ncbi:MAG: hypothetical protein AAGD01_12080 [Acidobacteriota bacterium]
MTQCIATIQEGHQAEDLQNELTAKLKKIAADAFHNPAGELEVRWKVIPRGYGWTAGKPSNSSVLLCVVPDALPFDRRSEFMHRVNEMWIDATGADASELLIVTHGTRL